MTALVAGLLCSSHSKDSPKQHTESPSPSENCCDDGCYVAMIFFRYKYIKSDDSCSNVENKWVAIIR